MKVIELLQAWLTKNHDNFEKQSVSVKLVEGIITDNPGGYFDIDTKTRMARVIVWESLAIDFEAYDLETQKQVIAETHVAKSQTEVFHLLDGFIDRLR